MKQTSCYALPEHLWTAVAASPSAAQARCDVIQADFRAGDTAPRRSIRREPPPLAPAQLPTDDPLKLRLAEELDYARRIMDSLGDTLSSDPALIRRHMVALQSIDVIGQLLGHVAAVIRSSDPDGAVERIGMSELKARLTRRSID